MFTKPLHAAREKAVVYRRTYEEKLKKGRVIYQHKKQRTEQFYRRYEKYLPLAAFVIGFVYDSLTLSRIDSRLDNFMLLGYTVAAGVLIAVLGMVERGRLRRPHVINHLTAITGLTHFFLGSLLSSYVVFYFKSAAVGKSFIFVGLLVILMLANEFFSDRLRNLRLLCAIYFFCCFAFLTFFLPVMTHVMSAGMFISSGLLSFTITSAIITVIYFGSLRAAKRELVGMAWPPVLIFFTLVLFYFLNWMPPVPLALKDDGIFRSVRRVGENYEVRYGKPPRWQFWKTDERDFAYAPGDTVYCFTAVFSPAGLKESIVHHWQRKNAEGDWITTDKPSNFIRHPGRDGGWRSYTYKKNMTPGKWRIEVKTAQGRLLGRIPLEVTLAQAPPQQMKIDYRY